MQAFFGWLTKNGHIDFNPASDLELPKLPARLPMTILSSEEIESVLSGPDLQTTTGLRDRALLELLWSTGIRRAEAANLNLKSIDWDRSVLSVRQGKGGKDRVLPLGRRAIHWLRRYVDEARAELGSTATSRLFVNSAGKPTYLNGLGNLVHQYLAQTGTCTGRSCHVFRHAMAAATLDDGADIRFVPEMPTAQCCPLASIGWRRRDGERRHPIGPRMSPANRSADL